MRGDSCNRQTNSCTEVFRGKSNHSVLCPLLFCTITVLSCGCKYTVSLLNLQAILSQKLSALLLHIVDGHNRASIVKMIIGMLFAAITFHCLSVQSPRFLYSLWKRQAQKGDERPLKYNTLICRSLVKRDRKKDIIIVFFVFFVLTIILLCIYIFIWLNFSFSLFLFLCCTIVPGWMVISFR